MSAENLSRQVDMSISGTVNIPFKLAEIRISTYSTVGKVSKWSCFWVMIAERLDLTILNLIHPIILG